ncbi:serine/threonine-protein kinase [Streptomyces sp. NPDC002533]
MTLQDGDPRSIGSYTLEGRLGAGGMGVVYRARSLSGRHLAIKVIRPELAQDPVFRDRFRHEVAAARRVSGAFTAPVVDADAEAAAPWLATLFVPGPSLAERVARQGSLPLPEVRRLAAGLAEALRDIHGAGLVHRDLKPGNVLLAQDGPRVIDFGISRASGATQLTQTGSVIGTPPFMAPEQFRNSTVGPAADVFSLGSVLVHAATGHGPFDGDTSHTIGFRVVYEEPDLSGLPEELRSLVTACLAKDPVRRPTPQQLLEGLTTPDAAVPPPPAGIVPATPVPTIVAAASGGGAFGPPVPLPAGPFPSADMGPAGSTADGKDPGRARRRVIAAAAAVLVVAAVVSAPTLWSKLGDGDQGKRTDGRGTTSTATPTPTPTPTSSSDASCTDRQALLRGSGSSTQHKAVMGWIRDYTQLCPDDEVTYEGTGAGLGLLDFSLKKDTDFAVLNEPMTPSQATGARGRCGDTGTAQIPVTTMPVAVVFHLSGVDSLVLDAKTVAGLFSGKITRWNAPDIARLNRAAPLPDKEVRVFHHRGLSQSTLVLSHYLEGAAGDAWPYRAKEAMPVKTGEGLPEKDVAEQVKATDGSVSYLPLGDVTAAGLAPAHLDTGGAEPVFPNAASVTKGAGTARRLHPDGADLTMVIDNGMRTAGAYPVFRFGYAVLCVRGGSATGANALPFFRYVLSDKGQQSTAGLGHGPLPDNVARDVRGVLDAG